MLSFICTYSEVYIMSQAVVAWRFFDDTRIQSIEVSMSRLCWHNLTDHRSISHVHRLTKYNSVSVRFRFYMLIFLPLFGIAVSWQIAFYILQTSDTMRWEITVKVQSCESQEHCNVSDACSVYSKAFWIL